MAVSTSYAPLSYSGNGATVAFSITWPFFSSTDIVAILVDADGVETTKTITTHYSVTGGQTADGIPSTGTLTMVTAPASGETLRIHRATSKVQSATWTNGGSFQAKTIEAMADRLTLISQEIAGSSSGGGSLVDGVALLFESSSEDPDFYDARDQIIRNVADPVEDDDAVTKGYGDTNYGGAAAAAAAASASSAASSATSASASATAAAAAYDSFDDRFLGAKTSDPLVDNDGAALSAGTLYFNTATSTMRVYGGASWSDLTGVTSINGESGIVTIDADDLDAMTHAAMGVINAADYVVGDGVTDDTAALASAFTAAHGKTLYVPAGLTILTGNISLLYSSPTNIPSRVVAHGATFKAKSGLSTASYLLTLENVHGSAANFRWEGGTFDCDGKCRGIRIHGMQRGYVGHIRVIKSYAYAVDIEGDSGYGIYYNLWENWRIGESGSENGSTGINDYANGSTYYNGANMFLNCTVQFNKGHGIAIDYSQNTYVGCSIEKNDLYGYSFNHTHATTIVGGYSENNHLNWATDGASDGSTDYSFNFTATNTTGVKIYGGRHAPANGTLSGAGNVVDVAYPGNQGIFFDGTTFAANGQYKFPATQNASTDANTLDDYEEGTWTPAITFGGGSTGLTHSAQEGTYTKIGRQVFVRGSLTLSAKGSSTGQARVTGLPFSSASGKTGTVVVDYYSGLTLATGIVAEVPGGSSSASFYIPGASSSAGATDANFTNTSALWFSGFYHV